jgi:energy-coupling factor transport system ATP-binding protein
MGTSENCVRDINLSIAPGEVVLLCGESGCGKTTLTRLINGLIPQYYQGKLEGEVLINGEDVGQSPLYKTSEKVASVFQNPRTQFFNVDTTSELAFGCENMGLPETEIEQRIEQAVDRFGIETLLGKSLFKLSGGEKQKIACASVSTCHPDIYVLDEPSSNLDKRSVQQLKRILEIWKAQGKTIIIAEHRLYYLSEIADRVVYMKDGRIEKEFSMAALKQQSLDDLSGMGLRPISLQRLSRSISTSQVSKESFVLMDFSFAFNGSGPFLEIPRLALPEGSIIAVIGHNGAGKTTFARCMCGLERKGAGVVLSHNSTLDRRMRLKNTYMVMQDVNHQLFTESVLDEVLLSMEEENIEKAEQILSLLDIQHLKEMHPMALSGGQKQRVAIASAIASEKEWVLFDEPTSGLDYRHMQEVIANLKKLQQMGKTLFVISHDLELILGSCTHVLHFEDGHLLSQYALDEDGERKLIAFFE